MPTRAAAAPPPVRWHHLPPDTPCSPPPCAPTERQLACQPSVNAATCHPLLHPPLVLTLRARAPPPTAPSCPTACSGASTQSTPGGAHLGWGGGWSRSRTRCRPRWDLPWATSGKFQRSREEIERWQRRRTTLLFSPDSASPSTWTATISLRHSCPAMRWSENTRGLG